MIPRSPGRRNGILALALFWLAACSPQAEQVLPLRIAATSAAAADTIVAENTAQGLTTRDAAGKVIPGLAQSWRVSDDGLSIIFRLRPAQFADGRPVTAADVTRSLANARRSASPVVRSLLAGVVSISAALDDVVEITLSTPQPELLELLAHPDLAIAPGGRGPLRAGPFVRAERAAPATADAGQGRQLVKSDAFFDAGNMLLESADVRVADPEQAILAFRKNETDIVTGSEVEGLGSARIVGGTDILRLEVARAAYVLLVNQTAGALADLRVRQAIAMAIDRERIGPQLFGTTAAAPVAGIAPAAARGIRPTALPDWQMLSLVQRREEALRLMEEAGHGPDNRLSFTVSATSQAADAELLALVAADLAGIGVDLTLGRRAPAAHDEAVARGEFDLALVRRSSPIASPLPFLDPLRCGQNRHGSCLEEADQLMAESWKAPTPAERTALLTAAERLWAEDAAAIGIVQPVRWSLVSRRVAGWTSNPTGVHPLRFLSITPERRLLQ